MLFVLILYTHLTLILKVNIVCYGLIYCQILFAVVLHTQLTLILLANTVCNSLTFAGGIFLCSGEPCPPLSATLADRNPGRRDVACSARIRFM